MGLPATPTQISITIGIQPVCSYGYYGYLPYACAVMGITGQVISTTASSPLDGQTAPCPSLADRAGNGSVADHTPSAKRAAHSYGRPLMAVLCPSLQGGSASRTKPLSGAKPLTLRGASNTLGASAAIVCRSFF